MKKILLMICGLLFVGYIFAQEDLNVTNELHICGESNEYNNVTISSDGQLIIESDAILKVDGTLVSPEDRCLIIKEGGQVIFNHDDNNDVHATVQKTIKKYDDGKGWYSICSPMNAMTIENSDFVPSGSNYTNISLYWFNESDKDSEWKNYYANVTDDSHFSIFNRGYLYANQHMADEQTVMEFKGILNDDNVTISDVTYTSKKQPLKGFNLVGNPFAENIFRNNAYNNENIVPGYYIADAEVGTWKACNDETPITPGVGILIKLNKAINNDNEVTVSKPDHNARYEYKDNGLCLNIYGDNVYDRLYVYFDEGAGLNKIDHLSETAPSLSVRYEDTLYAIAHVGEFCKLVDVVFENTQSGWYTLYVDNDKVGLKYLHLIDNITGDEIDMLKDNNYKFYAFGNENENRFKLVMNPIGAISNDNMFAYVLNGDIIITGLDNTATLQVFDVMGRMISSELISKAEGVACRTMKPDVAGVYVLRLINENSTKTQKIVVE